MQRLLKKILLVCCLSLAVRSSSAFSLLGEVEAWQIPAIGHNEPGDIGGVKNLGEEYRWNLPVITYGFDSSFLNYFGSNGVAAVDAAFNILNSLPPFSTMNRDLDEFPLLDPESGISTTFRDSRRENPRARANSLLDLKSITMSVVLEELGLAEPERFVWTLRDRRTPGNPPRTNYLVMMRNFDPATGFPSAYVNGTRYTYEILEDPQANADAFEIAPDPEFAFSSVAYRGLSFGIYYNYLTRDDIGGLRYIYQPDNVNVEPFPPNTSIFTPDLASSLSLTNADLTLFSLLSRTVSPTTLSNLYPGLLITGATPAGTIVVSNQPVLVTNTIPYITNSQQVIVNTVDLNSFTSFTRTNAPAAVLAQFPDLVLLSTNVYATTQVQVASITFTNAPLDPWDDPFTVRPIFLTNFVTNAVTNFAYSFGNIIITNFSPVSLVRRETTGVKKFPWSDALNPIYMTTVEDFLVSEPSGAVIIRPTNVLAYQLISTLVTTIVPTTNIIFQTNVVDQISGLPRLVQELDIRFFTNFVFAAFPVELLPAGETIRIVTTNGFTTNTVTTYDIRVGNVITNYSAPTTPITRYRYIITPNPLNPNLPLTNVIGVTGEVLPVPSGGFLIDTNLTGYVFTATNPPTVISITNVVFDFTNPDDGARELEYIVYNFTNTVYTVVPYVTQPAPDQLLRGGVDKIQFVRIGNGTIIGNNFSFTNRFQITYYTNGAPVRAAFQVVQTRPDILFAASDLGTVGDDALPVVIARNDAFDNRADLNSEVDGQGGPGTIFPPVTIQFSKIGPHLLNQFPGFTTEASTRNQSTFFGGGLFVWGSFDGSTNAPIIYPQDLTIERITLEQIEARTAGTITE
jgi:hypothetical protein